MPFRIQAKSIAITIAQTNTSKETAMTRMKAHFGDNLEWAVIARESHQDGGKHLHIALKLKTRYNSTNQHCMDFIAQKHGNYKPIRNQYNWLEYLQKEDKELLEYGIVSKEVLSKRSGKTAYLAERIMAGEPLEDLRETEPGYFLLHQKAIEYFAASIRRDQKRMRKRGISLITVLSGGESATVVRDWLMLNVGNPRHFKQKQLYIQAPPNSGKTSLMMELSKSINIYWIPIGEDFDDEYEDGVYDLIVFDEFRGQRKITWMNKFVEGGPMSLRRKGSQYLKETNPPVVVMSNFSVEECYSKCTDDRIAPFIARFDFVVLNDGYMEMEVIPKE